MSNPDKLKCLLSVRVAEDGQLEAVELAKSSGDPVFDQSALDAVEALIRRAPCCRSPRPISAEALLRHHPCHQLRRQEPAPLVRAAVVSVGGWRAAAKPHGRSPSARHAHAVPRFRVLRTLMIHPGWPSRARAGSATLE